MPDEHRIERLNDAHQALLRCDVEVHPVRYVSLTNRLFEACVTAGMSHDEPDHEAWAAERVARWLVAA